MGYAQVSGLGMTGTRLNAEMHLPRRRDNYLAVARLPSAWETKKGSDSRKELRHRWCAFLLRGHGCPTVSHTAVACLVVWCRITHNFRMEILTQRKDRDGGSLVRVDEYCSMTGDSKHTAAAAVFNLDYHLGSTNIMYYVVTAKQRQSPKSSGTVGQM